MKKNQRGFGSDNHSGVHHQILEALAVANSDHAPSYGTDDISIEAHGLFKQTFGAQALVQFVFNGTAANVLCLRLACDTFNSVLCADVSHLNVDECGAPEILGHCKLIPVKSKNGKISVDECKKALIRKGDQHFSQVKVLSLTQPTEYGTLYSYDEMKQLITWAKSEGLLVHIDGARFSNAAVLLNKSFKELTTDLGVDLLSFGGTKNGLLFGEAVIILNPDLKKKAPYLRKQLGQLPSKSRFVASQFIAYLKNDLWREIATHSLKMAQHLRIEIESIPHVQVTQPTDSNAVFARIPQAWVKPLRDEFFFYVWDEHNFECRFMTTWDTQIEDIKDFAKAMKRMSHQSEVQP
jgi:threonine aldolase